MKKTGFLRGKFIKKINDNLYKFQGEGLTCYVSTNFDFEFDLEIPHIILVRKQATILAGLPVYYLIRFTNKGNSIRVSLTNRLKHWSTQGKKNALKNPAFTGGKYKAMAVKPNVGTYISDKEAKKIKLRNERTRRVKSIAETIEVIKSRQGKVKIISRAEVKIGNYILYKKVPGRGWHAWQRGCSLEEAGMIALSKRDKIDYEKFLKKLMGGAHG